MLQSHLFNETVQLAADQRLLVLNSAADPFVPIAARRLTRGRIVLAEDNVAALQHARASFHGAALQHVPFHECMLQTSAETLDVALMNLLYQPAKAWMLYGLEAARYAL